MAKTQAERKREKKFQEALDQLPFNSVVDQYFLRKYALEIGITVCNAIEGLAMSDTSKIRRPDIGIEVRGYYNYPHNIKLDVIRLDRERFFHALEEVPGLQLEEKE